VRLISPTENGSELHSNEVTEQTVRAARRLENQQRKRNRLDTGSGHGQRRKKNISFKGSVLEMKMQS
jgi:hypothetical protein